MSKTIKAALLSLLVFPGAGHFFLKKYTSAAMFISCFSIPLILVMIDIFQQTNKMMEQIINHQLPLDIYMMSEQLTNLVMLTSQSLDTKAILMTSIWILSVLDTYRITRPQK